MEYVAACSFSVFLILNLLCYTRSVSAAGPGPPSYGVSRQASHLSTASSSRRSVRPFPQCRTRKDSVKKLAIDGIRSMLVGGSYTDDESYEPVQNL